jgi:predicted MFS family arabinose efflux permease
VLALAQLLIGICLLVPALTPSPVLVAAGFFVGGVAVMAWNITNVSLRQSLLPSRLMGRVHATHRVIANLAELIGAFAAGIAAQAFGLEVAFAAGAAVVIASVALRLVVTESRIRAAEAAAEAESTGTAGVETRM